MTGLKYLLYECFHFKLESSWKSCFLSFFICSENCFAMIHHYFGLKKLFWAMKAMILPDKNMTDCFRRWIKVFRKLTKCFQDLCELWGRKPIYHHSRSLGCFYVKVFFCGLKKNTILEILSNTLHIWAFHPSITQHLIIVNDLSYTMVCFRVK